MVRNEVYPTAAWDCLPTCLSLIKSDWQDLDSDSKKHIEINLMYIYCAGRYSSLELHLQKLQSFASFPVPQFQAEHLSRAKKICCSSWSQKNFEKSHSLKLNCIKILLPLWLEFGGFKMQNIPELGLRLKISFYPDRGYPVVTSPKTLAFHILCISLGFFKRLSIYF